MIASEAFDFMDLMLDKTGSASIETLEKQKFIIEAVEELLKTERKRLGNHQADTDKIRTLYDNEILTSQNGTGAYADFASVRFSNDTKFVLGVKTTDHFLKPRSLKDIWGLSGQGYASFCYVGESKIYALQKHSSSRWFVLRIKKPTYDWTNSNDFVNLPEETQRDVLKKAVRLASAATEDPRYPIYNNEEQES